MKTTFLERFFASDRPAILWLSMVSFIPVIILALNVGCESRWHFDGFLLFSTLVLTIPVLVLGYLMGALTGCIILPLFCEIRDRINGAPFGIGEKIIILGGKDMGKIGIVSKVMPIEHNYMLRMSGNNGESYERAIRYAKIKRTKTAERERFS